MNISILLDDSSIAMLSKIKNINTRLNQEIETALDDSANEINTEIPAQMNWQNPTGTLAASFGITSTPGVREISSPVPYARRREFGFSGMTDSLGRTYTNDPGAFYLEAAIAAHDTDIIERFGAAIDAATSA